MDTQMEAPEVPSLKRRYRDAYIVARVIVGVGSFIKGIGITLAILFFLIGFIAGHYIGTNPFISLIAGVIIGGSVGALFYIGGILVSAQGQILKASLDSAVNSSPFLTNEHRAEIMSLRRSARTSTSSEDKMMPNTDRNMGTAATCEVCGKKLGLLDKISGGGGKRCQDHLGT